MNCGIHVKYPHQRVKSVCNEKGIALKKMLDFIFECLCQCLHLRNKIRNFLDRHYSRRTRSADEVLHIVNEAALKFIDKLLRNEYDSNYNIEDYFFGFCKNVILNESKRKDNNHLGPPEDNNSSTSINNPEKEFESKEFRDQLMFNINKLKPTCRALLELWVLGYKNEEIAIELGMNKDNVRKRLSECRKKLRDLLDDDPFF